MPTQNTKSNETFEAAVKGPCDEKPFTPGSILRKYTRQPTTSTGAVAKKTVRCSRAPDATRLPSNGRRSRDVVTLTPAGSLARRETRHAILAPRDAPACHGIPPTKENADDGAAQCEDDRERKEVGKEEGTNTGERNGSEIMKGEGAIAPGVSTKAGESCFLDEALTNVQSSNVWFVFLCHLASLKEPVPMDRFNWALKCAIGLLHISNEEELSPLRFKSSAIHALSGILKEKDYSAKQKRLTHFIQTFKILMTFLSHLVSYTKGKTPPFDSETGKHSADEQKALLLNKLAVKAPLSVVQSTDVKNTTAKEPLPRGNSTQSVEIAVSSGAEPLNSVNALLFSNEASKAGSPESITFSPASNQRPSNPQPALPLPFNWMNSDGNTTHPTTGMHFHTLLSGIETHREELAPTTNRVESVMTASLTSRIQETTPYIHQNSGVLPIPETTQEFSQKLTPPKLTDRPTSVLQQTSAFPGRTMAFVRNNSASGILPPSNRRDQFLVLPSQGFPPRLTQLDERGIGTEKSDKGTLIPFSAAPLAAATERQSLPVQEPSGHKHQDPITPTTPFLEPYRHQSANKRTRGGGPHACPVESPLMKKQLSMSHFHTQKREKDQRLIKCLLTSGGRPCCSLFHISGFVDNDIWLRLPATIAITQFEDKTAFEQRSKQVIRVALKLDEQVPCSQAVPQLYEQNLVAIATLTGINLIVVPTHPDPHIFDIEVFVASTRFMEAPSASI